MNIIPDIQNKGHNEVYDHGRPQRKKTDIYEPEPDPRGGNPKSLSQGTANPKRLPFQKGSKCFHFVKNKHGIGISATHDPKVV